MRSLRPLRARRIRPWLARPPTPPTRGLERKGTIVIVEHGLSRRSPLPDLLAVQGFRVRAAETVGAAERAISECVPDAILLDLGLPGLECPTLLRWVRAWSAAPVLVVSAPPQYRNMLEALEAGADDYVTRPVTAKQLLRRIEMAIRRPRRRRGGLAEKQILQLGPLRVDRSQHEVTRDGERIHLTPIEFRLLVALVRRSGRVLSHRRLIAEVWGPRLRSEPRLLHDHMADLRTKLEPDPSEPRWLLTKAGVGYQARDPGPE